MPLDVRDVARHITLVTIDNQARYNARRGNVGEIHGLVKGFLEKKESLPAAPRLIHRTCL